MSFSPPAAALAALLTEIVDYAGLFPPAALPLSEVVARYRAYRQSPDAWMLGRLVLPAGKLAELAELAAKADVGSSEEDPAFSISAVVAGVGQDPQAHAVGWQSIAACQKTGSQVARVEAIECRVDTLDQWQQILPQVPAGVPIFWELPLGQPLEPMVAALAAANRREAEGAAATGRDVAGRHGAKVRTGGLTPEAIPTSDQVAIFLHCCARHRVAFKATAGLHHPLRSLQPLTYEADSPRATMHGFLNVFLAAAAAWTGPIDEGQLIQLLEIRAPQALQLDEQGLSLEGRRWSLSQLSQTRREFAIGFGSCSFEEPLQDLRDLGFLPHSAKASP